MANNKEIEKYNIESTTLGYPELELALHKAVEKLGWKGLTCHLHRWCKDNQPKDTVYTLQYWDKNNKYDKHHTTQMGKGK